jgi:predicted peptidase
MKKLFALILAITMMATLSVTAFAADYDTTGDKGMTVTYSVAPAYTVTIPTDVTIDGNSTTISAEDVVVEKGQYVSVTLAENNNFTVKTTEGAELTYTVTANGENIAASGEILAVNPADGKTGTATVSFDIDEAAIQ